MARCHTRLSFATAAALLFASAGASYMATLDRGSDVRAPKEGVDRLAIVWTSADPDVAHRMTLMYAGGAQARGWFDEVRLVVWGPSQRLVVADKDVRASVERLIGSGVSVYACLACADSYGIAGELRAIDGLEVKYMGEPLSGFLKSDEWKVITF